MLLPLIDTLMYHLSSTKQVKLSLQKNVWFTELDLWFTEKMYGLLNFNLELK